MTFTLNIQIQSVALDLAQNKLKCILNKLFQN